MWKAGYWTKLRDCSEFLAKGSGHITQQAFLKAKMQRNDKKGNQWDIVLPGHKVFK